MSANGKSELERRQEALEKMRKLNSDEVLELAVRAGIYTPEGELTPEYRSDATVSASRPSE